MDQTKYENMLRCATKLVHDKGFSSLNLTSLSMSSGISESTARRYFKSDNEALFLAVLESASKMIYDEFVARTEETGLDLEISDPKELVILYTKTVLSLIEGVTETGMKNWQARILFAGFNETPLTCTENMIVHISILDKIILRGCGGIKDKSSAVKCIILGIFAECSRAKIGSIRHAREHDMNVMLTQLEIFLLSVFQKPLIQLEKLEEGGVSMGSLQLLSDELTNSANAIKKVLSQNRQDN